MTKGLSIKEEESKVCWKQRTSKITKSWDTSKKTEKISRYWRWRKKIPICEVCV